MVPRDGKYDESYQKAGPLALGGLGGRVIGLICFAHLADADADVDAVVVLVLVDAAVVVVLVAGNANVVVAQIAECAILQLVAQLIHVGPEALAGELDLLDARLGESLVTRFYRRRRCCWSNRRLAAGGCCRCCSCNHAGVVCKQR